MPLGQVAVPAQHGVPADQQAEAAQHLAGQRGQEGRKESAVPGGERCLPRPELPLEDTELVAKRQDLHVLLPVAHR